MCVAGNSEVTLLVPRSWLEKREPSLNMDKGCSFVLTGLTVSTVWCAKGGMAVEEQPNKALAKLKIMRLIEKKRRARYEKRYVKKAAARKVS